MSTEGQMVIGGILGVSFLIGLGLGLLLMLRRTLRDKRIWPIVLGGFGLSFGIFLASVGYGGGVSEKNAGALIIIFGIFAAISFAVGWVFAALTSMAITANRQNRNRLG